MSFRGIVCSGIICLTLSACVIGANWSPRVLGARGNTVLMSNDLRIMHGALEEGWKTAARRAQSVRFVHGESAAVLTLGVQCGQLYEDIPLKNLMGQLFAGIAIEQMLEQSELEVAQRAALRQRSLRRVDGRVAYCDAVVLKKDRCQVDAYVIAAPEYRTQAMQSLEGFVQGLDF